MIFLFNDLSLYGQFGTDEEFLSALVWLMGARRRIEKQKLQLRCHRLFLRSQATATRQVQDIVKNLTDRNRRRQIMAWLANKGPFWDDERLHTSDDYLEVSDDIVTDTAIGEAAMAIGTGSLRALLSMSPSTWLRTPIEVGHVPAQEQRTTIPVPNLWTDEQLEDTLGTVEEPLQSWLDLAAWAEKTCSNLALASDVIRSLDGWPFIANAAEKLQIRLKTLDRMKECFTDEGGWNQDGLHLHANHFVGKKAWFTDSSEGEKHEFKNELTFKHPRDPTRTLFCPWHGKVKIQQMRIHFSWPIVVDEPIYVVYIGPKITKR